MQCPNCKTEIPQSVVDENPNEQVFECAECDIEIYVMDGEVLLAKDEDFDDEDYDDEDDEEDED